MLFLNPPFLSAFLFGFRILAQFDGLSILTPYSILKRFVLKLQVCSYCLNIGQDWSNVALTMEVLTKYW